MEFDLIFKLVELRKQAIRSKINEAYDLVLKNNNKITHGLNCSNQRIKHLSSFTGSKDRDVFKVVERLDEIFNTLTEFDLNFSEGSDLTESIFTNSPLTSISKALENFDFKPINNTKIEKFKTLFEKSKIIENTHISPDFISMFPEISNMKLWYRLTKHGIGNDKFFQYWANKGSTVILIKANDNYIFGGYNPLSWFKENVYLSAPNAFLFSVTNGTERKAIKFPVKKSRSDKAIKCWELPWSPGFGEEGSSDLHLDFKNLRNSSSKLGSVYEVPEGFGKPENLLAGRKGNWNIEEIEVYSITVKNE